MENVNIAIVGLGYVGMPLAIEFAKKYNVVGFDINKTRVEDLLRLKDQTHEVNLEDLKSVLNAGKYGLKLSSDVDSIADSNVFIVTVPTPIDKAKKPDLSLLISATKMVAQNLKVGDVVIYESTVYPGCTEEDCVPILELYSNLKYNTDFHCGYSPERINPGDKINTLTKIKKVTSGSTAEIAIKVNNLYASIITAGTYLAPSIKVAEASKAIENAQRDVNISFVNELSLIFDKMNIDTDDVLKAASTKWNFLNYKPGLVGGHCIGVDPYYLAYKSEKLGYKPEVILSGRRINDNMGKFVAQKVVKLMIEQGIAMLDAKVLILGFAFKENCPDTRNTKVIDIVDELKEFSIHVDVYDPLVNKVETLEDFKLKLLDNLDDYDYDAVVLAVAHNDFINIDFEQLKSKGAIIFDTKSIIPREFVNARL